MSENLTEHYRRALEEMARTSKDYSAKEIEKTGEYIATAEPKQDLVAIEAEMRKNAAGCQALGQLVTNEVGRAIRIMDSPFVDTMPDDYKNRVNLALHDASLYIARGQNALFDRRTNDAWDLFQSALILGASAIAILGRPRRPDHIGDIDSDG